MFLVLEAVHYFLEIMAEICYATECFGIVSGTLFLGDMAFGIWYSELGFEIWN